LVLASSSSSVSDTFWAASGVIVALVAILVSVLIWRLGSPRRLLLYNLVSDAALLSSDARSRAAGAEFQIILGGRELDDPHFVSLRIVSRSRLDIRVEDFSESRPLVFELAAPILKVLHSDTGGDVMPEVITGTDGSTVTVGPSLINRRQVISLNLLTEGPVTLTCPRPALADVRIREGIAGPETTSLRLILIGVMTVTAAGLILGVIGLIVHNSALSASGSEAFFPDLLFLFVYLLLARFFRNRRARRI